ncbi:MAG: VWA domain-containing protein [Rubricoccaceae bacterium]
MADGINQSAVLSTSPPKATLRSLRGLFPTCSSLLDPMRRLSLRPALALGLTLLVAVLLAPTLRADDSPAPSDRVAPILTGSLAGVVTDAESGQPLVHASVSIDGTELATQTGNRGQYVLVGVPAGRTTVQVTTYGYATATQSVQVTGDAVARLDFALTPEPRPVQEVREEAEFDMAAPPPSPTQGGRAMQIRSRSGQFSTVFGAAMSPARPAPQMNRAPVDREGYAAVEEVGFRRAIDEPLSTFSIDVDRASYANARRFLMRENRLPVPDAVRVEEFVNSFDYGLEGPGQRGRHPFTVHTEVAEAPWNADHQLVRVALQGRRIDTEDLQPANLVFLLDVSGSMSSPDKLPLLKQAFRLLVREMRPEDHVSIVVYAGASGLVLEPTPGTEKDKILDALDRLQAGGSTAGAEGIQLAYRTARQNFDRNATNRVILATDGDFNVGMSSDGEMKRLIERERESGVFLSVLGFGTGNLQDSKMETLANAGNGNYAYIDSAREAERVFVREFGGTLVAIAKDVKIQVEFNPAEVAGYRLIGYENRRLRNEEFNDDTRDAGELGAGHTVTALYEIIPHGVDTPIPGTDGLKYQRVEPTQNAHRGELMTVKLRYKPATGPGTFADESDLLSTTVSTGDTSIEESSEAMRWATAVTEAALVLQETELAPSASLDQALALARTARGADVHGDRAEFIRMIETARALKSLEEEGPIASTSSPGASD